MAGWDREQLAVASGHDQSASFHPNAGSLHADVEGSSGWLRSRRGGSWRISEVEFFTEEVEAFFERSDHGLVLRDVESMTLRRSPDLVDGGRSLTWRPPEYDQVVGVADDLMAGAE